MNSEFTREMDNILSDFSQDRGNLIPILQNVQEKYGYIPEDAISNIANFLRLSSSTVYSVCTFYTQFKLVPSGKKAIKICRGTACHVGGGANLLCDIERRLCIKPGETTKDLEYSLETVACVGACALAPVMIINDEVYGRMNTIDAAKILGNYHTAQKTGKGS